MSGGRLVFSYSNVRTSTCHLTLTRDKSIEHGCEAE
jgi:hypothetical protein